MTTASTPPAPSTPATLLARTGITVCPSRLPVSRSDIALPRSDAGAIAATHALLGHPRRDAAMHLVEFGVREPGVAQCERQRVGPLLCPVRDMCRNGELAGGVARFVGDTRRAHGSL